MGSEADAILNVVLLNESGEPVTLGSLGARVLVVYFYPRAMTPGCTREALRFNELLGEFESLGAVVVGVSTDPPERIRRFREKHGLRVRLLSDPEGRLASTLGILRRGARRASAERVTYIIVDGKVAGILRGVRPAERHADLALGTLRRILGGGSSAGKTL